MNFILESKGIVDGVIQDKYGKRSETILNGIPQISMPISWRGYPEGARSFVIIFLDNDNYAEEGICWLHWSVANIPAEVNALKENCSVNMSEVDGRIVQGKNSWMYQLPEQNAECNRYGGPAPVAFDHEYELKLYALNDFLNLKDGYYHNQLLREMKGKILAEATLFGIYKSRKEECK